MNFKSIPLAVWIFFGILAIIIAPLVLFFMNLEITSSIAWIYLSILGVAIGPSVLFLFSRLFKFPKNDFKTAFYSNLIILGIFLGISFGLNILIFNQILKSSSLSSIVSLIVGTYIIHKFYGSSLVKSFFALLFTGATLCIGLLLLVMVVAASMFV